MPVRSSRITCLGATAAGIATTLLIGGGSRFSAAPLGDGRWLIEAEVADATASLLALRIGEPPRTGSYLYDLVRHARAHFPLMDISPDYPSRGQHGT